MKIEQLTKLFADQTVKLIILETNEVPYINQNNCDKQLTSLGKITNATCEAFLEWLQQELPSEQILPTQDNGLHVYTSSTFRLVVNAMIRNHYTITITKK